MPHRSNSHHQPRRHEKAKLVTDSCGLNALTNDRILCCSEKMTPLTRRAKMWKKQGTCSILPKVFQPMDKLASADFFEMQLPVASSSRTNERKKLKSDRNGETTNGYRAHATQTIQSPMVARTCHATTHGKTSRNAINNLS